MEEMQEEKKKSSLGKKRGQCSKRRKYFFSVCVGNHTMIAQVYGKEDARCGNFQLLS